MNKLYLIGALVLIAQTAEVFAADAGDVKEKWHTPFGPYLTPQEAHDMKKEQGGEVAFLDVRTRAEVKYIGMTAMVDANIPVRFLDEDYNWSEKSKTYRTYGNDDFVNGVKRLLKKMELDQSSPVILMCQSGSRAPRAARILHEEGFTQVYTQYQGFEGVKAKEGEHKGKRMVNGWKNAGLPWSYDLDEEKMYFSFTGE